MSFNPVYKVADFSTRYLNVPPNMHRLRNAVGLCVGLYAGRKLMDIVTGETMDGKKIDKADVIPVLRPLLGVMPYDHFSDNPKDRWMKVFDMCVPAVLGGIGAAAGSASFFSEGPGGQPGFMKMVQGKLGAAPKNFTLANAERQTLYHQSQPAALAASHAAGYGSSGGLALFNPVGSPMSYSSTLGALFTMRGERSMVAPYLGKSLRAKLFNSHSLKPLRPTKMVGEIIGELAGNPSLNPKNFAEDAEALLKTWFEGTTPQQIAHFKNNLLSQRNRWVQSLKAEGKGIEHVEAEVAKNLSAFLNQENGAFEKRLIEAGIDPRSAAIGNTGVFTHLARKSGDLLGMGTTKKMLETQTKMIAGMEARHPELLRTFGKAKPADLTHTTTAAKVLAGTITATGIATVGAVAMAKDTSAEDLKHGLLKPHRKTLLHEYAEPLTTISNAKPQPSQDDPQQTNYAAAVGRKHIVHSHKDHGVVNGKVLDTAEGITGMFNAGIGSHRVHCAVGLMVGSWMGDKVMEAMTGRTFAGARVPKEKIWKPLQKIYRSLEFNPHSDMGHDKWMQVMRWAVPAVMGTVAVVHGSKMFFEHRHDKLKDAKTLDVAEDKATMAQSQPWAYTAAVSGLFGFPSGFPMLPMVNYSTNLGTRFSMGSGRKVSLPVVGKIWSNNSTLFPFGPPGMIDMIIKEAMNNKAYNPEMLETYTVGVLKPWFDNVKPEQVEQFVMEVHRVRDKFYKDGGVPENMKAQLEAELKAHFKGAGLEETLEKIGLDPLNATIASNGLSGAIANMLGAKKDVEAIQAEFAAGYRARLEKRARDTSHAGTLSV